MILAIALMASVAWTNETFQAKVVGISDGEAITVLHDRTQTKIRLYGMDTPEMKQAFGNKAKQFTAGRVFGETVKVIPMGTDRYKRTVDLVYHSNRFDRVNAKHGNRVRKGCKMGKIW